MIDGVDKYHLHEILTGENKGNFLAIEQLGTDKYNVRMFEYKYIIGKARFNDFRKGKIEPDGMQYQFVRFAKDNGANGDKTYGKICLEDIGI